MEYKVIVRNGDVEPKIKNEYILHLVKGGKNFYYFINELAYKAFQGLKLDVKEYDKWEAELIPLAKFPILTTRGLLKYEIYPKALEYPDVYYVRDMNELNRYYYLDYVNGEYICGILDYSELIHKMYNVVKKENDKDYKKTFYTINIIDLMDILKNRNINIHKLQ